MKDIFPHYVWTCTVCGDEKLSYVIKMIDNPSKRDCLECGGEMEVSTLSTDDPRRGIHASTQNITK